MSPTDENPVIQTTRREWESLTPQERHVIDDLLFRVAPLRDPNQEFADHRTLGERVADRIASFGGSWTFILLFLSGMMLWAFLNTEVLGPRQEAFDPYPYVFLNLVLSMLAALQAPIIMMSQSRQNTRDRLDAEIDHEVNVRAELAIHHVKDRMAAMEQQMEHMSALLQRHMDRQDETGV